RDLDPLGTEAAIAGDDDIEPTGQGTAETFERLSPHHHRLAEGLCLETLQIARQAPRQTAVAPDDAVPCDGRVDDDPHRSVPPDVGIIPRSVRPARVICVRVPSAASANNRAACGSRVRTPGPGARRKSAGPSCPENSPGPKS